MNARIRLAPYLAPAVVVIMALMMLFPVTAAPGLQTGENLPTPTLFPVDSVDYSLEVVGGAGDTFTFSHTDQDGFVGALIETVR
jgi:hypothetical protein